MAPSKRRAPAEPKQPKRQKGERGERADGTAGAGASRPRCALIAQAVSKAEQIPAACREMLAAAVPFSLGVPSKERDKRQVAFAGFIGEALSDMEAHFLERLLREKHAAKEEVSLAAARAQTAAVTVAAMVEEFEAAEEQLALNLSTEEAAQVEQDRARTAETQAEKARSTAEAQLLAASLERDLCRTACAVLEPDQKDKQASEDQVSAIHKVCEKLGLEDSLLCTLPLVLQKPVEGRSYLEKAASKLIMEALQQHMEQLSEDLTSEESKNVADAVTSTAQAAQADRTAAEAALAQAHENVRKSQAAADELRSRLLQARSEETMALAKFQDAKSAGGGTAELLRQLQKGPIAAYQSLEGPAMRSQVVEDLEKKLLQFDDLCRLEVQDTMKTKDCPADPQTYAEEAGVAAPLESHGDKVDAAESRADITMAEPTMTMSEAHEAAQPDALETVEDAVAAPKTMTAPVALSEADDPAQPADEVKAAEDTGSDPTTRTTPVAHPEADAAAEDSTAPTPMTVPTAKDESVQLPDAATVEGAVAALKESESAEDNAPQGLSAAGGGHGVNEVEAPAADGSPCKDLQGEEPCVEQEGPRVQLAENSEPCEVDASETTEAHPVDAGAEVGLALEESVGVGACASHDGQLGSDAAEDCEMATQVEVETMAVEVPMVASAIADTGMEVCPPSEAEPNGEAFADTQTDDQEDREDQEDQVEEDKDTGLGEGGEAPEDQPRDSNAFFGFGFATMLLGLSGHAEVSANVMRDSGAAFK